MGWAAKKLWFDSCHKQDGFGVHPAFFSLGMGGKGSLFTVVKQLGYKADCSLRSSSKVKFECCCTSFPPLIMVCTVNISPPFFLP